MNFRKNSLPGSINELLYGEGFFISYNPKPGGNIPSFEADNRGDETALVVPGDKKEYRILNGDFRKEYLELVPKGLEACIKFFDENEPEHGSSWTTPIREEEEA